MRKTHPDRKDPIYCVLRSELRRSERAFSIWQNFEPSLADVCAFGQNYVAVNGQILDAQSSHLVTLHWSLLQVLEFM